MVNKEDQIAEQALCAREDDISHFFVGKILVLQAICKLYSKIIPRGLALLLRLSFTPARQVC